MLLQQLRVGVSGSLRKRAGDMNACCLQVALHQFQDAAEIAQFERVQFFGEIVLIDHSQAVGLDDIGRGLGEKAIRYDADRATDCRIDRSSNASWILWAIASAFMRSCSRPKRQRDISSIDFALSCGMQPWMMSISSW